MTVLFADVVGSTASTAKSDLEAGYAKISPAVEMTVAVIKRYGGTINKLLGDGVMGTFGAPVMMEDHAIRACRCAAAVQAALGRAPKTDTTVRMRIGINSGPALITEEIEGAYSTYDVHGPTVNLTSRIEAEASPDSVYISESTFRLVRHAFTCTDIGLRSLKGFDEPQHLYELMYEEAHEQFRGLAGYRIETPFLGRAGALAAAMLALTRLENGSGGLLLVVGEAGVGKSRFLTEMRRALPTQLQWLEGHCDTFTERISFWPFIGMLRSELGLSDGIGQPENWSKLQQNLIDRFGSEVEQFLPYTATFLGIDFGAGEQERLRRLDPEVIGAHIFRAARYLIGRMAERSPCILVLEDLHWADHSSHELLEHLLVLARNLPILFIVLSRPESERLAPLREAASRELGPEQFYELMLPPLTVEVSQQLLIAILGSDERLGQLRDRILYKVEGNPFFLEEVIRELIDLRALVRDEINGAWSIRDLQIAIPQTVEAVLVARIDRLDERLRDILGVAAVIGRTFFYRLLRTVTAVDVDEPLATLVTNDLIQQLTSAPELAYLFRHALTHQAVYNNLLLEKRSRLHAQVAQILEELFAGRLSEITSLLAFHYARAEMPERSLRYLMQAAEQSSRMAADGEALALLEEAIASQWHDGNGGPAPGQRARIEWLIGEIHFRRGDPEQAERHLLRALELSGTPMPRGQISLGLALTRELARHVLNLMRSVAKGTTVVARQIDPGDEPRIRPYQTLDWIYFLSDHRRLFLAILRSANVATQLGYTEGIIKAFAGLGLGYYLAGLPRVAARYHRRARAMADQFNDPASSAFATILWGNHLFARGRWREAEQALNCARQTADRIGDLITWSDASVQICEIWNETANFERVLEVSEVMIGRGREAAFRPALRWGLMARGKALRRTGRLDDASRVLGEALQMCTADRDLIAAAAAAGDLVMALIALHRDEAERVLTALHREVVDHKIWMYTLCHLYLARAELVFLRLERGTASVSDVRRACGEARRLGRAFSSGRAGALRLTARLAWLSGRQGRADRIWRRAVSVAEALGADYELGLIKKERDALQMARTSSVA